MTLRFTLTLETQAEGDKSARMRKVAVVERGRPAPETLGLSLAEAKAILPRWPRAA